MKAKYVAPESRLLALNMSESIAASGGISEVSGSAIITFTQVIDGCRGYHSGDQTAPVTATSSNFIDYYNELKSYNNPMVYFNCFSYKI